MDKLAGSEKLQEYKSRFHEIDKRIVELMDTWSIPLLRVSIALVFIWFGALKVVGVSPAADLVSATVYVVPPELFVPVLGVWEVVIGICLLYRPLIRVGIFLLFLQLPGTFLPIVLLPDVVFTVFPYGLTVEGQYIIKNLVIIGGALAVGSTVRAEEQKKQES